MNSDIVKVAFIFVLVYGALFALSFLEPLQTWNFTFDFGKLDYTLFLLPIPGFFFIYSLIPWMRQELGFGRMFIMAFPILLIIFSFIAFAVAVFYFYGNQASLAGVDISAFNLDYISLFLGSSFIYFMLAGVGGWGARILIENFDETSGNSESRGSSKSN